MTEQTQPVAAGTKYLIYEADADGKTLTLVGEQVAGNSEQAIRKFFESPPEQAGTFTAISVNSVRLREIKTRVTVGMTDIGPPTLATEEEAEQTELPVEGIPVSQEQADAAEAEAAAAKKGKTE